LKDIKEKKEKDEKSKKDENKKFCDENEENKEKEKVNIVPKIVVEKNDKFVDKPLEKSGDVDQSQDKLESKSLSQNKIDKNEDSNFIPTSNLSTNGNDNSEDKIDIGIQDKIHDSIKNDGDKHLKEKDLSDSTDLDDIFDSIIDLFDDSSLLTISTSKNSDNSSLNSDGDLHNVVKDPFRFFSKTLSNSESSSKNSSPIIPLDWNPSSLKPSIYKSTLDGCLDFSGLFPKSDDGNSSLSPLLDNNSSPSPGSSPLPVLSKSMKYLCNKAARDSFFFFFFFFDNLI
jgi:hypothetical protein